MKVKRMLCIDNPKADFDEVKAFKTDNGYIGLYNFSEDNFIIMPSSDCELYAEIIGITDTLQELDDLVYDKIEGHITDVYVNGSYEIKLLGEEE